MTELCGACLSRGRRVTALGAARAKRVMRATLEDVDAKLLSRLAVCWECRTFVEKSIVFCERVRRAQTALRDENLAVLTDAESVMVYNMYVLHCVRQDVDATLLSRLAVCWECRTFVEKSIVFCERVRRAQTALRDENLAVLTDAEVNAASMSTLGQSTKVGFDFVYQLPEPEEAYICGLPETDIATTDHVANRSSQKTNVWEVSLSRTALFPVTGLQEVNGEMVIMSKMKDKTESESEDDTDDNIDMKVQDIGDVETKVQDIDDIETKVQDIDDVETKVQDIDDIETKVQDKHDIETKVQDNMGHIEIIKNSLEPILKENYCIVMRDLTKKSKTYKIANLVPPSLTIKRINGNEIEELKVLKPSELKTILLKPLGEKKKTDETMKNLADSSVTIKKPQRPSKIKTVLMSEVEMQQSRDEERNKEQYVQSLFKCETCIVGFKSEAFLEDHNKIRHRPELGEFACDICSLRFQHPDSVAWHRKTHYTLYLCKCGYAQRHLPDVKRHYAALHEPAQTHRCHKCEEVFAKPRQLRYHVEKAHYDPEKCAQCDKTFTTMCAYKRHVEIVHGDRSPVACPVCGRKYRGQQNMHLHMRAAHRAAPAPPRARPRCEPCALTFQSSTSYRTHLTTSRSHVAVEDMKYKCLECDKRFALKRTLQEHHAAKHIVHKTNVCQKCDKAYGTVRALRDHERRAHSAAHSERVRDQVCEHCGKAFYSTRALLVHAVVHSDARPFVCSTCDASFRFYAALYTHNKLKHKSRTNNNSKQQKPFTRAKPLGTDS